LPEVYNNNPQQEPQEEIARGRFDIGVPLRILNTIDDKLYVEYMMDSF